MRADINLSVRPEGSGELGTRTEMKNMNSFKAIHRAVRFEARRQIELLQSGGRVVQETRRWDDNRETSYPMRTKENAQDYRYFPEPDLPPVEIGEAWIESVRDAMPEPAEAKRARYRERYGLSEYDAEMLTSAREYAALFEAATALCGQPREVASLIMVELMRLMSDTATLPEHLSLDPAKLASLVKLITGGAVNRNAGKEIFEAVFREDVDPEAYMKEHGLAMVDDDRLIEEAVEQALRDNPKSVEDYRGGKEKAYGFLVGQTMRALGGKANPQTVNRILKEKLSTI